MIEMPPLPAGNLDIDGHLRAHTHDAVRAYGEACALASIRAVWLAAGGFEHSVPKDWRSVLTLVRELQILASTVPNPLGVLARHHPAPVEKS